MNDIQSETQTSIAHFVPGRKREKWRETQIKIAVTEKMGGETEMLCGKQSLDVPNFSCSTRANIAAEGIACTMKSLTKNERFLNTS